MIKAALGVGDLVIQIPWDACKVSSFVVMYQRINKSHPSRWHTADKSNENFCRNVDNVAKVLIDH